MSRQRLIELLVVMFGVLVALGLENLVEEIRLRGDAQDLEVSFQEEIYAAVQQSWLRQAVAPCLSNRLTDLTERVAAARTGDWIAVPALGSMKESFAFATPQLYRMPVRQMTTSTFDRALGSEAFKRVPKARVAEYGAIFATIDQAGQNNTSEFLAAAALAPMASSSTEMTPEVRADLMQQISLLDRHRALGEALADSIVDASLTLPGKGVRARTLASEPEFRQIGALIKGGYGSCVDLGSIDRLMKKAGSS